VFGPASVRGVLFSCWRCAKRHRTPWPCPQPLMLLGVAGVLKRTPCLTGIAIRRSGMPTEQARNSSRRRPSPTQPIPRLRASTSYRARTAGLLRFAPEHQTNEPIEAIITLTVSDAHNHRHRASARAFEWRVRTPLAWTPYSFSCEIRLRLRRSSMARITSGGVWHLKFHE